MINYTGLPQRVRRIVKQYDYCISMVGIKENTFIFYLKDGYQTRDGRDSIVTSDLTELIYSFKYVTKLTCRSMQVSLFSFQCPICKKSVNKGSNHIDLGGLKLCCMCGLPNVI